ncbi:MAG TPA: TIGR03619 family F420-dependent LLM class oxidoreductase [Candidatus Dormibacteraeota bacterium]|nr:TIGR03619 family F420-dependent LLM class oxidoreductase [Candidatus Dormibacteraeota bacterium]
MELGVFLPVSGRAAGPETLREAALSAEAQGFDAVWSAERIVQPGRIDTPYPYAEGDEFIAPPDRPFLDALACLAFLAGCTSHVRLGVGVTVLPYHHPLRLARIVATLDRLSRGRFLFGVGVGWMREEFAALGVPFEERGRIGDEQIEVLRRLWGEPQAAYEGRHYRFRDVAFEPKAPLAIWVGGEGRAARRRAGRLGDRWFPYFVRIVPEELALLHQEVRGFAVEAGRDPDAVRLAACAQVEVTDGDVPQEPDRLRGSPGQLAEAVERWRRAGVEHLALQFMAPRWPERREQIARFAEAVIGAGG